jgi:cytochrome c biogenesis protein CcdA
MSKLTFLGKLVPAALADSINLCAFAMLLMMLLAILSLEKNYKRAIKAGLLFVLAVFIVYYLMGVGIFSILSSLQVGAFVYMKWIVAGIAIFIALLNMKDFFRYGRGFVMETPISWRPKMHKIVSKVTSP